MERRPEMRRTMTLSEQLSKPDPAIREFLGVPHDDGDENRTPSTLMDAIGRDESGSGGIINWKPLRDRLQLRHIAAAWTTITPSPKPAATASTNGASGGGDRSSKYNYSPGEAAAAFSRTFSRSPSLRATPTFSRATSTRVDPTSAMTSSRRAVDDGNDDENEDEGRDDEEPAAKMSLMALLEQTDNQSDDEEEEDDDDEEEDDDVDGAPPTNSLAGVGDDDEEAWEEEEMAHVCCVCMVRHKGAAFIPCGHTFCRLCSRELWVSRGNCPLCNGFIQEILDIF